MGFIEIVMQGIQGGENNVLLRKMAVDENRESMVEYGLIIALVALLLWEYFCWLMTICKMYFQKSAGHWEILLPGNKSCLLSVTACFDGVYDMFERSSIYFYVLSL